MPRCSCRKRRATRWWRWPSACWNWAAWQTPPRRCGIAGKNASAVLAHALGDFAGALRAYLGALELARSLGDRRYEAHVLVNLANTFEESGLPAESLEHSRLALGIATALGMDELVGDIHHNIGNALAATGEHAAGLASNQRALQAYAALQLPQKESYALVAVASAGRASQPSSKANSRCASAC